VLVAAVVVVGGSGAGTAKVRKATKIDVSTRSAVIHYLRSIHVNPRGAVIQRGARNYAGPRCPGKRWTCAKSRHTVVQIAQRGGQNRFVCRSSRCVVVQFAGTLRGRYIVGRSSESTAAPTKPNKATCIRTTGLGASCSITQMSATADNQAVIYENAGKITGLTQTASYTASITQQANGSANTNTACVTQAINIDGSTNAFGKKGPVTVTLEAHQSVTIRQDSTGGTSSGNFAQSGADQTGSCVGNAIKQDQSLSSTVTGSGSITQNENDALIACGDGVSGDYANMCLDIEQNQGSGKGVAGGTNNATFRQTNLLTAIANTPVGPVSQTQSSICPNPPGNCVMPGGLVGTVNQDSTGVSTASATQTETQCEDAAKTGLTSCDTADPDAGEAPSSLTQKQYGPEGVAKLRDRRQGRQFYKTFKGFGASTQTGNTGDIFTITQSSKQDNDQGSGSTQTNTVQADCSTPGNCTANQTTTVNGSTTQATSSGQNVNSSINCTGSTCAATPPPPMPTITSSPPNPSDSSSATVQFTDTDPTVTFECQIDNSGYSGCASPWTYDNLADGSHTFYVKAKNGTGQVSDPATFTWTIAGGNANASTVQQLNPTSDPAGGDCADGYASVTGFMGVPQKVNDTADLTAFDGQPIQLRFSFSTIDANYNAFEGWYVKNIQVTGTQSGSPVTVFSDAVADGDTNFTASSDFGVTPGWHVTDRRNTTFGGPAWWYGNENTGTYQSPNPIDSCTDSSANAGTITSPVFTLATNSQLSFDTLWQIESVNPATFDLMDVQVLPVTSGPAIG
jgi:hypothetical protein